MCRRITVKSSFLRKEFSIKIIKGVINSEVNKIKKILSFVKTTLSNNKNSITVALVTSLFWVSIWGIDEVKDAERHTKLKTEHSMLIANYQALYKVCETLEENNVKLQVIIRDQGIMLHKAENFINEQKKVIEELSRRLYSTQNDTAGWASHE